MFVYPIVNLHGLLCLRAKCAVLIDSISGAYVCMFAYVCVRGWRGVGTTDADAVALW